MNFSIDYLKGPQGILKIVEIVLVIISFGIFRGAEVNVGSLDGQYFAVGVLVTALIITPLLLVSYLMGIMEIQKSILEVALNFLLFLFLLSVGSFAINTWGKIPSMKQKSDAMAMGSFCILASIAYLADFILSALNFRNEHFS
ncbi:protein snakeskin-like [Palaemon carinicauda]|uniref:protein snakeskin-like n=1 Tax=Palaemon carinicauda TaxID=392227 RepID=UPI0035B6908C